MNNIKTKKNLQKIYKEALYRAFYKSEAIIASYPEGNGTHSKLTLIREILTKKITIVRKLEDKMLSLMEEPLELLVKQ